MIKKIINNLKSLNMDITCWMNNKHQSVKEKIYKNRKIFLIIDKTKNDTYVGKIMIMKYKKELYINHDSFEWKYVPILIYKTKPMFDIPKDFSNIKKIKTKMENIFKKYFIEKNKKIFFIK